MTSERSIVEKNVENYTYKAYERVMVTLTNALKELVYYIKPTIGKLVYNIVYLRRKKQT